jgi:oxygen-independent coproporphyrinogen-3 oxidase
MENKSLLLTDKYNVAVPRYTSYPTMPYWDANTFDARNYGGNRLNFHLPKATPIGHQPVYIHLPYCESLCTYCGCNTRITKNHRVEEPYIAAVLKEWAIYLAMFNDKPVIREIHLGGGTPTFFSP